MRLTYKLTSWLAARQGLELHYPPRPDPGRGEGTLQNDGTPCAPNPRRSRPTTYHHHRDP